MVRFAPRKLADLQEIYRYIAERNRIAAGRVIATIERRASQHETFPHLGQAADMANIRVLLAIPYPYRIYYRLISGEVSILHVRHTSRRPPDPAVL